MVIRTPGVRFSMQIAFANAFQIEPINFATTQVLASDLFHGVRQNVSMLRTQKLRAKRQGICIARAGVGLLQTDLVPVKLLCMGWKNILLPGLDFRKSCGTSVFKCASALAKVAFKRAHKCL